MKTTTKIVGLAALALVVPFRQRLGTAGWGPGQRGLVLAVPAVARPDSELPGRAPMASPGPAMSRPAGNSQGMQRPGGSALPTFNVQPRPVPGPSSARTPGNRVAPSRGRTPAARAASSARAQVILVECSGRTWAARAASSGPTRVILVECSGRTWAARAASSARCR